MIQRAPTSTPLYSSAAAEVYKRQLLNDIEKKKDELKSCEASINELDDDLRETLVHRSKVIGKDRFLNLSLIHISEPTSISGSRMPSSAWKKNKQNSRK